MQHEGDTYCEIKMERAEEGRNLERGGRQMSKKKNVGRDIRDREDQEKMVLFKSVEAERAKAVAIGPCPACTEWVLRMAICLQRRIWILAAFDV